MPDSYSVAILGATGMVGQEFIKILEQRQFPVAKLKLLASPRSAGKRLKFRGEEIEVTAVAEDSFDGVDVALFSAGAGVSKQWAPVAVRAGAVVVDNSSGWRMEADVPLVVPEVNGDDALRHNGIIANPNCSTIQMVVALWPIHQVNPIKRVVVSTYQSVSGAGSKAVRELDRLTRDSLAGAELQPAVFAHPIAFNCVPEIDVFFDDGYSKEEWKMLVETRKIMHEPELPVSATTVRVPVALGHAEAVNVELAEPMDPATARELLRRAPGVEVRDDPRNHVYPLQTHAAGTDPVYVGRIRQDSSHPNGLVMWIVADNIRKGAALNAVQIAELLIQRGAIRRQPSAAMSR
ncbi:MAG: aspartate-semialdehyde dehydrogenase [Chloroflexi bacterium]|nr:aspartate-semialdehyde dehydrogenase [Chloroflexota bacterium]